MLHSKGIDEELNEKLETKTVKHRQRFAKLFKARYLEMLPSLINYTNCDSISVDFLKVEVALRNGYDVVLGETKDGSIQLVGYATTEKTTSNPGDIFGDQTLKQGDINFIIPKHLRAKHYKEITNQDDCTTGNFVVLRNKVLHYISDIEVINHYVMELAEIVLSRYSISMQVKISTLFLGDVNDQTVPQLISDLYNGNPYIKMSKLFDPEDQIYHMQNDGIAQNFQELKREYQNKISELNNMLGMNSLAVEKSSGVSDEEAKSNRSFTTSNANIYLDGRNNGLEKLNKRYDLEIEAIYNDEVMSEFIEMGQDEDEDVTGGDTVDDNNDTI